MNEYKNHPKQRGALHVWLSQCAEVAADAGLTMDVILSKSLKVSPTMTMFKEQIYKPILKALEGKDSTEDQETVDVEEVRKEMIVFFADNFGITLPPFPDRFNQYRR